MECCLFPSSGPAVGCLCVLYPGNTRFQRNYQNFGAGRPKAAARNRCRGSTGIRLCPVPVGAPLGRALPSQHWQHLWLQSPGMLMPQCPSSTTLGSPSQDFHPWITAREDTAEPGRGFSGQCHQPSYSRNSHQAEGESRFQGWFGFKQGLLGAGAPSTGSTQHPKQSWHLQALEGLGAQKWDRAVKLE